MLLKNNNIYRIVSEGTVCIDKLPTSIYKIEMDESGNFYLVKENDKFSLPAKVYDDERPFIEYVKKGITQNQQNTGVLLNGAKGSGKSLTSKIICNELELPVVIVENFGSNNLSMFKFLTELKQEVIFFIDEFEKKFTKGNYDTPGEQQQLLSFMDGVYNSDFKKVFILTTNNKYVEDNLISRPSRIRYVKEFVPFTTKSFVEQFLAEELKGQINEEQNKNLTNILSKKKDITLDILSQVVKEVEIQGYDSFIENIDIFNLEDVEYVYFTIQTGTAIRKDEFGKPETSEEDFIAAAGMKYSDLMRLENEIEKLEDRVKSSSSEEEKKELCANIERKKKIRSISDDIDKLEVVSSVLYEEIVEGEIFDGLEIEKVTPLNNGDAKFLSLKRFGNCINSWYYIITKPKEISSII